MNASVSFPYRYRPFEGLASLQGAGFGLETIDAAQARLGCVPKDRLRELVMLFCAAAILQRPRDASGIPFFLNRGGLTLQYLLGDHARPTHDIDSSLRCGFEEYMDKLHDAVKEPFGPLRATIEDAHTFQSKGTPFNVFTMGMHLVSEDDTAAIRPYTARIEGTFWEPSCMLEPHAYPAPALDALGLPEPDALWGVVPARFATDKMVSCAEPLVSDDPRHAGYVRPLRRAKHVADLITLRRMYKEGRLARACELRRQLDARIAYENGLRKGKPFVPIRRPLRVIPQADWESEYYVAAIQAGLDVSYEEAVREVDAWMAELS